MAPATDASSSTSSTRISERLEPFFKFRNDVSADRRARWSGYRVGRPKTHAAATVCDRWTRILPRPARPTHTIRNTEVDNQSRGVISDSRKLTLLGERK